MTQPIEQPGQDKPNESTPSDGPPQVPNADAQAQPGPEAAKASGDAAQAPAPRPAKPAPDSALDPGIQRELDEALGDMSIDDLMAAETAKEPPEAGAARPAMETPAGELEVGRVTGVDRENVFIELPGHRQGVLPIEKFEEEPVPEVGKGIRVAIEGYDEQDDLLLLSREGAVLAAKWETVEKGQVVEGRAKALNKGGLELDINGLRAFLPLSQIDLQHTEDASVYLNEVLRCVVTEVDRREGNLVVSRRDLLKKEQAELRRQLWETLKEGDIVEGQVRTIMPYGAFVDIGGTDGLLHVSDMAHRRVENPQEVVTEGQRLQVKVLKLDREKKKISLGLKQVQADPWEKAPEKWPEGSIVEGVVTRLMDFGAFVQLEEGVEGLIPMGELVYGRRINNAGEVLSTGDNVKVRVLNVDTQRKRIGLSLKQVGEDPWMGASVRFPTGGVTTGKVTRVAEFGAFVEVGDGIEGLMHISELSTGHVKSVGDAVKVGQEIQVKVLSVDEKARRMSLSVKALSDQPKYEGQGDGFSTGDQPRKKRKKPLKGGLD